MTATVTKNTIFGIFSYFQTKKNKKDVKNFHPAFRFAQQPKADKNTQHLLSSLQFAKYNGEILQEEKNVIVVWGISAKIDNKICNIKNKL